MTGKNWASAVLMGEPPLDPSEICEACGSAVCECIPLDDWFAEDILADRASDYDDTWDA